MIVAAIRRAAGLYHNSAVIIDADGSLLGTYRKMHIPDDPLYYEKFTSPPAIRAPRVGHRLRSHWRVDLLGSVVPEAARLTALLEPS